MRMWMLDLAREQSPTMLHEWARLSLDSGYDSLGLYLEHRFAYDSAPWATGAGALTPEHVRELRRAFPELKIVPFINLLGHFEGFLYTEHGKRFAEERFKGLQACPSNQEFVELAQGLLDDTMNAFESDLVHIGGDETWQLGACPKCNQAVESHKGDGKAELYAKHFAPLAQHVIERGARPAVWGDMVLDHPDALDAMPKNTLIFDWQYFSGLENSAPRFTERGFEVVGCPTLHTYNSPWLHLEASEKNVRQVDADVRTMGLAGFCLTTWECGLFGSYETLKPAIRAAGKGARFLDEYESEAPRHREWAELVGVEMEKLGGPFGYSQTRSSLKVRLLLMGNPFLAWLHHGEELSGEMGEEAIEQLDRAMQAAPTEAEKGVTFFIRCAVDFVRLAERARGQYARRNTEQCVAALTPLRTMFDDLAKVARQSLERTGGSRADVHRCELAKRRVEEAIKNIRQYGDGSMGYLPAFEVITHPRFVPHDQGCWWLINKWASE